MKLTQTCILALFLIVSSFLVANVPNWSFDHTSEGWNASPLTKMYFHYSETQRQWAWELLGKISLKGNEQVLDFGCGDGKVTAELSRLVKNGNVLGVDLSSEMLHLAKLKFPPYAYPNLQFEKSESLVISDLSKNKEYDLVCAFTVFHLVADPLETLKNLRAQLKASGTLLLVIPTGTNSTIYQAADEMFAKYNIKSPWANSSKQGSSTMRTLEGCSFFLKAAGYDILSSELIETENAFYDLDELIAWMIGTVTANWNIPIELNRPFFTDLIQRMAELDSNMIDNEGRVRFVMPRIHIIAHPNEVNL
ncbi:MAG: methyltransferase [Chlamydiota bacterium]